MLKVLHLPKHLSHSVSVVCVSFLLDSKYLDSVCMWVCALSCLTLCNPMDYSLSGSSVREIFQARILEWVAISYSRGSSQPTSPALEGRFFTTESPGKPTLRAGKFKSFLHF